MTFTQNIKSAVFYIIYHINIYFWPYTHRFIYHIMLNEHNYEHILLRIASLWSWRIFLCSILQSLLSALRYENRDINWLINLLTTFEQEYVFMNRTVKEILWGYQDPALHFAKGVDSEWFYTDIAGYFINVSMSCVWHISQLIYHTMIIQKKRDWFNVLCIRVSE